MAHYAGVSRGARRGIVRNSHGHYARPLRTCGAHGHGARALRTQYSHGALPGRRDGDIAPYRHYARPCHTENSRDHYAREIRACPVVCAPRVPHGAVPLRAHRACARCAVSWCGPVAVGRDVPIAPPRRMARCAAWHRAKFANDAKRAEEHDRLRTAIAHGNAACGVRAVITHGGARGARRVAKRARLRWGDSRFRWRK